MNCFCQSSVSAKARREYKKRIYAEMTSDTGIKDNIIGQSILGGDAFTAWVKDTYIEGMKDRERPAVGEIHRRRTKEEICAVIKLETGQLWATLGTLFLSMLSS